MSTPENGASARKRAKVSKSTAQMSEFQGFLREIP